ncbi:MAG: Lrp/AsnC family transcriptional regulator [Candidatus Thorarchaeota archaeon]|jgi:Lrp/AsnC family leucine-responsive transcriptional regulator
MGAVDKPDDNDRTIIDILRKNARSSLRDIAKIVGMSPSSVRNRIERLVERGFVKRFTVDVDYRKMGYEIQVIVLITSRPGSSEEIYKALLTFKEIFKVYWTSGPANFVCIVRLHNMTELSQFMTGQLEKLEGVERVESMFLMPEPQDD